MTADRPESRMGGLWILKAFTGVFLIVILLIHLIVNHMVGSASGLLTYQEVINYYEKWFIPAMEILFLIFVVTHSLLGVRSIILDFNPSAKTFLAINWLLTLIGVGFIIYGSWLVIQIVQLGSSG